MKFMENIYTQEGPGVVIGRLADGGILVELNAREVTVMPSPSAAVNGDKGKPVVKMYPGPCVVIRKCEVHGVWYAVRCELCGPEEIMVHG